MQHRTALLLLLLAPLARADDCAQLPLPSVTLTRIEQPITLNYRYGYQSLDNIGQAAKSPGRHILGLTRGTASATFALELPTYLDSSGRWACSSPQITVRYGFSPMMVYIANEFPEGSCAHQQIMEHEMRHVKAYQAHLETIEKDIGNQLKSRFVTGTPWRAPRGETAPRLQREMSERWLPMIQRQLSQVEEQQQLIDTPEEYARVSDACDGEIKKRLR